MNSAGIIITPMVESDRRCVQQFIDDAMARAYGCAGYPLPHHVFVARCDATIVGTIGVSLPSDGELPITRLYEIDWSSFPGERDAGPHVTAHIGRWVALEPHVSAMLMATAAHYAIEHHCVWAMSEVKPQVLRRFRSMGISLAVVKGTLRWELVRDAVRPYYREPCPVLAAISVDELAAALWYVQLKWK